ncbi:MAG: putative ribonuclease [Haloplasmataceae bacterium]|nr:putative ribonuclease [Haloplasmataceae bacterium]
MKLFKELKNIRQLKIIIQIDQKLQKYTIYNVVKEVISILHKREVGLLPSYIAYFILLSFIPIISLIFDVVSLIVKSNENIINILADVLPNNVYGITVLLFEHNTRSWELLTISNITLLFLASRIYSAFYRSYLIIFNAEHHPHFINDKIVAIINTLLLIVLIFILTIFTVLNSYIYNYVSNNLVELNLFVVNYFNIILSIIIMLVIVTFLMYSVPNIKQRIKDVFLGALFVTLGWIAASFIFKYYVDNYANYQTVYKTFATVIVFVTWIYLICYILIIGIAINKANSKITRNKKPKNR